MYKQDYTYINLNKITYLSKNIAYHLYDNHKANYLRYVILNNV